jgi:hypothetical protein
MNGIGVLSATVHRRFRYEKALALRPTPVTVVNKRIRPAQTSASGCSVRGFKTTPAAMMICRNGIGGRVSPQTRPAPKRLNANDLAMFDSPTTPLSQSVLGTKPIYNTPSSATGVTAGGPVL